MPSINRPNAPNRLPSADFGDLFFKPREPRTSEGRSPINTPSPLSTPANFAAHRRTLRSSEGGKPYSQSPLASPAVGTSQRRPQYLERSAYWTDSNARSGFLRNSPIHSPDASEAIEEEPTPIARRTPSATIRKIPSNSNLHGSSIAASEERAPREARDGFKWSRDFLGGWLEIRIGRQKGQDGEDHGEESRSDDDDVRIPSSVASTVHLPMSRSTTAGESAGHDTGRPLLPETPDSFDIISASEPLKEGLYCRTKRALGLKHGPITPKIKPRTRTPTGDVLDRVTSTLRFIPPKVISTSTSAATSVSNLSIAAPRPRRQRPGQRDGWSASSSVRNLLMGKPPAGTPEPEVMYTGSDSHQYLSVDLTKPDAPAFLPSEARRINTPPLPSANPEQGSSRGFFFDYRSAARGDQDQFSRRPSPPRHVINGPSHSGERDWYRVQLNAVESGLAASKDDSPPSLPEHFPNSPLCPRNPKHKSGGTGTCVYHGRNKSTPSDPEQTPTLGKTGTISPVPETWWMK